METIGGTLQHTFLSNTYWNWAIACAVCSVAASAAFFARRVARQHYERRAEANQDEWYQIPLQMISKTAALFVVVLALAAGLSTLALPTKLDLVIASTATTALFLQLGIWSSTALVSTLEQRRKAALSQDRAAVGSLGIIGFVLRFVVWALVLLLTLDNLGVDVTTLVAGFGIGGIAVALAVQNVLGDLLASLSITLDKPFVVGDFLILGEYLGSVEHIGIKSVRLRSLSGEQIIIANTDLLKSRVRNYGRMIERRVAFTLRVAYDTPRDALRKIPDIIRAAIAAEADTRMDRSHFAKFAEYALEFDTVYYVLSPDYNQYMDIQQRINFAIHEAFECEAIEFAVPTQRLVLSPIEIQKASRDDLEAPEARSDRAARGRVA